MVSHFFWYVKYFKEAQHITNTSGAVWYGEGKGRHVKIPPQPPSLSCLLSQLLLPTAPAFIIYSLHLSSSKDPGGKT